MMEAAKEIVRSKVLPAGYCVESRLDPRKVVLDGPKDAAGWTSEPASRGLLQYRLLDSPKLRALPAPAAALLPPGSVRSDCRHRLVIHEPQFIEIKQHRQKFIMVILDIYDPCPVCGAGYSMTLRRSGNTWKLDSPGLTQTWVS